MSYISLLKMRCRILEQQESQIDGMTTNAWVTMTDGGNVRCLLDLNYKRSGKDPIWTPETGTAQNRTGVLFLPPSCSAKPGFRIQMLSGKGPTGTFEIKSALDQVWTPRKLHHLECYVEEIDRVLAG